MKHRDTGFPIVKLGKDGNRYPVASGMSEQSAIFMARSYSTRDAKSTYQVLDAEGRLVFQA